MSMSAAIAEDNAARIDRMRAALTTRCLALATQGGAAGDRFVATPALLAMALQRSGKAGLMLQAALTGLRQRIDAAVSARLGLPQTPQPCDLADLALAAFATSDRRIVEALEAVADGAGGYFPHRWARQTQPGCLLVEGATQFLAQSDVTMAACLRIARQRLGLRQTVPTKILSRNIERRASLWIANPYLVDWLLAEALAGEPGATTSCRLLRASILTGRNRDGSFGRYDVAASTALAILALQALGGAGAAVWAAQQRLCDLLDGNRTPCTPFFQVAPDAAHLVASEQHGFLDAIALLALTVAAGDDDVPAPVGETASLYRHATVQAYATEHVLPALTGRADDEYPSGMRGIRTAPASITQYLPVILHGPALPALFSPDCIDRFAAITGQLPGLLAAEYGLGFEIRLGEEKRTADLSLCIARDSDARRILADSHDGERTEKRPNRRLPAAFLAHPAWRTLQELATAWDTPGTPEHAALHNLWLEFDLDQAEREIPIPGVFLGMPSGVTLTDFDGWAGALLARLSGTTLPAPVVATLRTVLANLPVGATLSHLGIMLSRRADALRLNIKKLDRTTLPDLLAAAGWRGDGAALRNLIDRYGPLAEDLTLAVDVADRLLPCIGLELHLLPGNDYAQRAGAFIRQLHADGLSLESKAAAIAAWPGAIDAGMLRRHAPAELLRLLSRRGIAYESSAARRLFHFKFVLQPDRPIEAKAYIGATFG